jgi:hypothetical protein
MIVNRSTPNPIARLFPIADTDRFELFCRSNVRSLDNLRQHGTHEVHVERAHEIVEGDPIFRGSRPPVRPIKIGQTQARWYGSKSTGKAPPASNSKVMHHEPLIKIQAGAQTDRTG